MFGTASFVASHWGGRGFRVLIRGRKPWNSSSEWKKGRPVFAQLRQSFSAKANDEISNDKHIVLLSGGVDSSTVLHDLRSRVDGSLLTAMFFQYGQRATRHELKAVREQCEQMNVRDLVEVDLEGMSKTFGSRRSDRMHVPLVHRNLILLAAATSLAGQEQIKHIWLAVTADDSGWYASAERNFLQAARECITTLGDGIYVHTPLLELNKAEVIQHGHDIGVRFETTWSCMIGRCEIHCGRCIQCRARKAAFAEAGIEEDSGFYRV